ncbi:MAG: TetR/AcrR family transcriptional regulator [Lachnospiraceae bacterium]|nr:TetR/AcrR family transcriptional regulator [Lachnospiraceae bacterium]
MAVYEKGNETKRRLILSTYEKLQEKDASQVTVREIAESNHCSPAALYRHFESLEYLIILASIRFFDDYMVEYGKVMDSDENLLKMYLEGWKVFNHYAFERPDLYYRLLWGQYNASFSDALDEYFELFPVAGSEKNPAYFYTLLFTSDIKDRDLLILKRAVNYNLLSYEDAVYFSRSNTLIVKGLLEEYMRKDPESRKKGEQECNQLLRQNLERVYILEE